MNEEKNKLKIFKDDGNGDCVYCRERSYDCCCGEKSAKSVGFSYDYKPFGRWKKGKLYFLHERDLVKYFNTFGSI